MREHLAQVIYKAFEAYCNKKYHFKDWPLWENLDQEEQAPYLFIADAVIADRERKI